MLDGYVLVIIAMLLKSTAILFLDGRSVGLDGLLDFIILRHATFACLYLVLALSSRGVRFRDFEAVAADKDGQKTALGLGLGLTLTVLSMGSVGPLSIVLVGTAPLFMALPDQPRDERNRLPFPTRVGIVLGVAGLVLIGAGPEGTWQGVAYGVGAGLARSMIMRGIRRPSEPDAPATREFPATVVGATAATVIPFLVAGRFVLPPWPDNILAVGSGVLTLGLQYLPLQQRPAKRLRRPVYERLLLVEVVFAVAFRGWLLHRWPSPMGWAGGAAIIAALLLAQWGRARAQR
ncbi:MAG: hypothetical protein ACR2PS_18720 [Pseudomonadales bacterium]